jgi:hypothetical protein
VLFVNVFTQAYCLALIFHANGTNLISSAMFGIPIQQVIDKQGPSGGKFPIVLRDTITFIFENKGTHSILFP